MCIYNYVYIYIYTPVHAYKRPYIHIHIHMHMHIVAQPRRHTCAYYIYAYLPTYIHIHTYRRTYGHMYIRTYIHPTIWAPWISTTPAYSRLNTRAPSLEPTRRVTRAGNKNALTLRGLALNIGAFRIRIGFCGPFYYDKYIKEPPKIV